MSFESSQAMISHVEDHLLKANSIDLSYIEKMLGRLNSTNIDFGDIYFQKRISESWSIDDRAVKNGSFSIDQGFGVRAVSGEKTALAYSDEINERALHQTVRAARSVSKQAGSGESRIDFTRGYLVRIKDKFDPVGSLPREQKVLMLREMDTFARSLDSRVVQVMANLTSSDKEFLVANTDGTLAADVIPGVHLSCTVIVEENGVRENGYSASGKAADLGFFQEDVPVISMDFIRGISPDAVSGTMEKRYLAIARDAVRCALVNLRARPAEAGELTVILASGWPAVLFHEAVGHGLEADAVFQMPDGKYALIEIKTGMNSVPAAEKSLLKFKEVIRNHNEKVLANKEHPGVTYREPSQLILICGNAPMAYTTESGVKVIPVGCLRD